MFKENLLKVIDYLEGKIDIYNGQYANVINTWNDAWDEMRWQGYDPQTINGIQKYMKDNNI